MAPVQNYHPGQKNQPRAARLALVQDFVEPTSPWLPASQERLCPAGGVMLLEPEALESTYVVDLI